MTKLSSSDYRITSIESTYDAMSTYDKTKLGLGSGMYCKSGNTYAGPLPNNVISLDFIGDPSSMNTIKTIDISSILTWMFFSYRHVDGTQYIALYEFDKSENTITYVGTINIYITITLYFFFGGIHPFYIPYSTGTVSVSGTTVTGSGTAWQTARMSAGSRIGFGSIDQSQITTWYDVASIDSDGQITLSTSAGTIAPGTSFIMEEVQIILSVGENYYSGLHIIKGLSKQAFSDNVTLPDPATINTDFIRAIYKISNPSNRYTVFGGENIVTNYLEHHLYTLSRTTSGILTISKLNIRALATSITSGTVTYASSGAEIFILKSLSDDRFNLIVNYPFSNNSYYGKVKTSNNPNKNCFYFADYELMGAGRVVYAFKNIEDIDDSDDGTSYNSFIVNESYFIPPTSTFEPSGITLTGVPFTCISKIGLQIYFTQSTARCSRIFEYNGKFANFNYGNYNYNSYNSSFDTNLPVLLSLNSYYNYTNRQCFYEGLDGTVYYFNGLYDDTAPKYIITFPGGMDTENIDSYLITPEIKCPNNAGFSRVYPNLVKVIGGATVQNLGKPSEPVNIYYRTDGIVSNTGTWILLPEDGDISGTKTSQSIQFKITFKCFGFTCIPGRFSGISVLYNKYTHSTKYQPSVNWSSYIDRQFAWRFANAFGGTVPTLYVYLVDEATQTLILSDNTASPLGTFEKSTDDGANWVVYNTDDVANETTYIRYTPPHLADNVKVRATLTEG